MRHLLHITQARATHRILECSLVFHTPAMASLLQSHDVTMTLGDYDTSHVVEQRWRLMCRMGAYEL